MIDKLKLKPNFMKFSRGRYFLSSSTLFYYCLQLFHRKSMQSGEDVLRLECWFKKYYGYQYSFNFSSCRMSVYFILQSLNLNSTDEIIITPITISDVFNAVRLSGANPIYVDLDPKKHFIDVESLKEKINSKTKVLLLTHLSGIVGDIDIVRELCDQHNILLIEDISQIHGAICGEKKVGSFGDYVVASLSVGKTISGLGGGLVLIRDQYNAKRIESFIEKFEFNLPTRWMFIFQIFDNLKINFLTNRFIFSLITHPLMSIGCKLKIFSLQNMHKVSLYSKVKMKNYFFIDTPILRSAMPPTFYFRMSSWQARIALSMIESVDEKNSKRKEVVNIFVEHLNDKSKSRLCFNRNDKYGHVFYHLPFYLLDHEKNKFQYYLFRKGIDTGGFGLLLCSRESAFSAWKANLPGAQRLYDNTLFIPVFEDLKNHEILFIAESINQFWEIP